MVAGRSCLTNGNQLPVGFRNNADGATREKPKVDNSASQWMEHYTMFFLFVAWHQMKLQFKIICEIKAEVKPCRL